MRALVIGMMLFCFCGSAFPDVEMEVIETTLLKTGEIQVKSKATELDTGEQVGAIDVRNWHPSYFKGKTKKEIKNIILADLTEKQQANTLYQYQVVKGGDMPYEVVTKEEGAKVWPLLPTDLVGMKTGKSKASWKFDLNQDGLCEEEWIIDSNGTEVRTSIIPTSCD